MAVLATDTKFCAQFFVFCYEKIFNFAKMLIMERIRLTRNEKAALRLTAAGNDRPRGYAAHEYTSAVVALELKGLVKAVWAEESKEPIAVTATSEGKAYLAQNPTLRNPINWAAISAIGTAIAVVVAVIALVVACNKC